MATADTVLEDQSPQNEAFVSLYHPLRRIARALLQKERRDTSLEATELVHQTIVSKLMHRNVAVSNTDHYLGLAAHGMKQIIIDRARRRLIRRREQETVNQSSSNSSPELAVMLRRELKEFARTDPRAARIIELRILGHHTWDEIAVLENVSARTARDDYNFAIAWLRDRFKV